MIHHVYFSTDKYSSIFLKISLGHQAQGCCTCHNHKVFSGLWGQRTRLNKGSWDCQDLGCHKLLDIYSIILTAFILFCRCKCKIVDLESHYSSVKIYGMNKAAWRWVMLEHIPETSVQSKPRLVCRVTMTLVLWMLHTQNQKLISLSSQSWAGGLQCILLSSPWLVITVSRILGGLPLAPIGPIGSTV
jgi:hypothetical protein